jgi:hypothetical protein
MIRKANNDKIFKKFNKLAISKSLPNDDHCSNQGRGPAQMHPAKHPSLLTSYEPKL